MPQIGEVKRGREIGKAKHPSAHMRSNKYIWVACSECGEESWVDIRHSFKRKFCRSCQLKYLHSRIGHKNPSWRGGRIIKDGYFEILLFEDDFFYSMANHKGYVYEHRLVMAKSLNRCLLPWEVVHHKNGIKGDNRLENLELLPCQNKHNTILNRYLIKLQRENDKLKIKIQELECSQRP